MWLALVLVAMSLSPSALADPAEAAPNRWPIAEGGFQIERGSASIAIHAVGVPQGSIDERFRFCRVTLDWEGSAVLHVRDCHPNLVDAVTDALARWDYEVVTPPELDRELLELWYVFPSDRTGSVQAFVRQATGQQLVLKQELLPKGVVLGVLPWKVVSRTFVEFPDEAQAVEDLLDTTCEVKIDLATTGLPSRVTVLDCDDVFHAELAEQLRGWRFDMPSLGATPSPSALTLVVSFARSIGPDQPSKAIVSLPAAADLGAQSTPEIVLKELVAIPIPPLPDHPPLFIVDHKSYTAVEVYEMFWPEPTPAANERSCDVLWMVNSKRRVWAWTEGCDEDVRFDVERAANLWLLAPGERQPGESYARFRATLVFPPDGAPPLVRLPTSDLRTKLLPDRVQSYSPAQTLHTVAPVLPKDLAAPTDSLACELDVSIDRRGHPRDIVTRSCPDAYALPAQRAISRWRWIPAEAGGHSVASRVLVRIRFK